MEQKNEKKIVRLTEGMVRSMVESIARRALREGHWDSNVYTQWEEIRKAIGDEAMLSELYNWLSSDDIDGFIQEIRRNYDLDVNDDEYDE